MSTRPLTADALIALCAFAAVHGREWKRALRTAWERGTASPDLQALRNSHGPSWLVGFSLDRVSA